MANQSQKQSQENAVHDRIRERLDALDLTPDGASRKAGLDKTYLRKLFERPDSSPRGDTLKALAGALETTPEFLLSAEARRDNQPPSLSANVRKAAVSLPAMQEMPRDLPVRGTAAGSHAGGAFQFEGGVIDYVRRPPALFGSMNAYGLYVEGTSMVPEHNPGDLRFVHPDRPPRIGDSVVVEIQLTRNGGTEAVIGRLLKRTEKSVFIGKLNPEATVELKRETVKSIHKVLTTNDLFGV